MERRTVIMVALSIIAIVLLAIVLLGRTSHGMRIASTEMPRPLVQIRAIDEALARGDTTAAVRTWQEAYISAAASRRWDVLVDIGDATLRLAEVAGPRRPYEARARTVYLAALFRARAAGVKDAVRGICARFSRLGDTHAAAQCREIARTLREPPETPLPETIPARPSHAEAGR